MTSDRVQNSLRRLLKLVYVFIVIGIVSVTSLVAYWYIDPIGFRFYVFQPMRDGYFFVRELQAFEKWGDIKKIQINPTEVIKIKPQNPGDVLITADLYKSADHNKKPILILLHGSQPWGRKEGLIRLLGQRFAGMGWLVIAPDSRGFGDSGDPKNINDPNAWKVGNDIKHVIDYATKIKGTDPDRIYVFGHSLGANYAMEGGLYDHRVKGIILVGPSRYLTGINHEVTKWSLTRFSADRRLQSMLKPEVMTSIIPRSNIGVLSQGILAKAGHVPILLIDGEMEGKRNLDYLKHIASNIKPPLIYHTLKGAGHYCGVYNLFGSNEVYYRPDFFNQLVNIMEKFLR